MATLNVNESNAEACFAVCDRWIRSLPSSGGMAPTNQQKLYFYGLYKQAKLHDCPDAKPSMFFPMARAKYLAWDQMRGRSKLECMCEYVEEIHRMGQEMSHRALDPASKELVDRFLKELARLCAVEEEENQDQRDKETEETGAAGSSSLFAETQAAEKRTEQKVRGAPVVLAAAEAEAQQNGAEMAELKALQQTNHARLCDLEQRLIRLLRRNLQSEEESEPGAGLGPESADQGRSEAGGRAGTGAVEEQITPFREELKQLFSTLEERLRRKEAEFLSAETRWNESLTKVEAAQRELMERLQGADQGGQQVASSSSLLSWVGTVVQTAVPVGIAVYVTYQYVRRRGLR